MEDVFLGTLLILVNLVWLFLVAAGLPGNWLMIGTAAMVTWLSGDGTMIHYNTLVLTAVLALGGEALETWTVVAGTRRSGGSWWGSVGAMAGAVVGGVLGTVFIPAPLVGTIVGACLGAAAVAWFVESLSGRSGMDAVRSAVGAGIGRLVGTVSKFAVGILIWLVITVAVFWP